MRNEPRKGEQMIPSKFVHKYIVIHRLQSWPRNLKVIKE